MKKLLFFTLLFLPLLVRSQSGITFEIEDLKKPDKLLLESSNTEIFNDLIVRDLSLYEYKVQIPYSISYNIVAQSPITDSLVTFGYHSFFDGMYNAYANHRPFVLSPDMIWLLISQGFAQHVTNNSEELRKYFVDFKQKKSLIVRNDAIDINNPNSPWESVFPEFTKQIASYTGEDLINALTCNFTTTTSVTKVASQITIMEAMKSYFDFIVIRSSCGIPRVTLEGTSNDWIKLLYKIKLLRKYELDWWLDEIQPILRQFALASSGKVDKSFWINMFKYHSQEGYGAPNIVDGWIVKFFPYDKDGKRNNLKELTKGDNLPHEIVKVDLTHIDAVTEKQTPLELWAGFVGLKQNKETFALRPEIAWMIRKKNDTTKNISDKLKCDNLSSDGITIRVKTVPKELLELEHIKNLDIRFVDSIQIPEEMGKMKIENFRVSGKISKTELLRMGRLFPSTTFVCDFQFDNEIQIPDEISNLKIEWISLSGKISRAEKRRIQQLLPETHIIYR